MNWSKRFLIWFGLGLALNAGAQSAKLNDLLMQAERPRMKQTLAVLEDYREHAQSLGFATPENSAPYFEKSGPLNTREWTKILIRRGPALIAALEYAYPGAKYAFIGRDVAAFADLVDAFYQHLGQTERVAYLGVSKSSFGKLNGLNYDKTVVSFLESHGLDIDSRRSDYPFVLVDTISQGYGRQGRTFLSSTWAVGIKRGKIAVPDLLTRVGMVGLMVSTFRGEPHFLEDLSYYQALDYTANYRVFENVEYGPAIHNLPTFVTVPEVPNATDNEASYTHFIGAWHRSHQPFIRSRSSLDIISPPGESYPIEMKANVLHTQQAIWDAVVNPRFMRQVQEEARKLGYEFSTRRAPPPIRFDWAVAEPIINEMIQQGLTLSPAPTSPSEPKTSLVLKGGKLSEIDAHPLNAQLRLIAKTEPLWQESQLKSLIQEALNNQSYNVETLYRIQGLLNKKNRLARILKAEILATQIPSNFKFQRAKLGQTLARLLGTSIKSCEGNF